MLQRGTGVRNAQEECDRQTSAHCAGSQVNTGHKPPKTIQYSSGKLKPIHCSKDLEDEIIKNNMKIKHKTMAVAENISWNFKARFATHIL